MKFKRNKFFEQQCSHYAFNSLCANGHKMDKHTRQFAEEMFECVWPFCKEYIYLFEIKKSLE